MTHTLNEKVTRITCDPNNAANFFWELLMSRLNNNFGCEAKPYSTILENSMCEKLFLKKKFFFLKAVFWKSALPNRHLSSTIIVIYLFIYFFLKTNSCDLLLIFQTKILIKLIIPVVSWEVWAKKTTSSLLWVLTSPMVPNPPKDGAAMMKASLV